MLLVATACATPQGPGAPGDEWPAGRDFLATSVTENGASKTIVEGTQVRVSFEAGGRISAYAGCNHMSGTGRIDSGTLVVTDLATTEMGCPGELMEQDAWVADLLTSRPTVRLAGDELTLATATITMVLLDREVADPDRPLAGTSWTVTTVYAGDGASTSIHPVPAVLTIDAATGSFTATTGCVGGELQGTAIVAGSSITFGVTEEKPCVGGSNQVDAAVRATLTGEVTYEIEADQLRLLRPNGDGLGLSTGNAGSGLVEVDCGTAVVNQGDIPPESMLTCFIDAVAAGRTAHLSVVMPTVEGDPIATSYRYHGGGPSIEVLTDTRQDAFRPQELRLQTCEQPRVEEGFLAFATCSEAARIG
ncbi:MAG: META domain-containing protein [Micromonosporaceae bacterium]|nr:META domain-containing protein [Micromonosporaceae bacterium]